MRLEEEQTRATEMLAGKVVGRIIRHRPHEVLIEFSDGTRFFINSSEGDLDLSITGDDSSGWAAFPA